MSLWNKFVVLEGLDGAGTTTQLDRLSSHCAKNDIPFMRTFEPSDGFIGRIVRDVLEKREKAHRKTLAELFAADRREHVQLMRQHLERGEWVFCDRYFFSSLAYQSLDLDFEEVLELNKEFPLPGKCLFIECSVETTLTRRGGRDSEELFEKEAMQRQVVKNYEQAFAAFPEMGDSFYRVDGEQSLDKVTQDIFDILKF